MYIHVAYGFYGCFYLFLTAAVQVVSPRLICCHSSLIVELIDIDNEVKIQQRLWIKYVRKLPIMHLGVKNLLKSHFKSLREMITLFLI